MSDVPKSPVEFNLMDVTHAASFHNKIDGREIMFFRGKDGFMVHAKWNGNERMMAFSDEGADMLCAAILFSRNKNSPLPKIKLMPYKPKARRILEGKE